MSVARQAWVNAARPILEAVARQYHATITYAELAETVNITGIRTGQLMWYWIGGVLGEVADECHRRGEPILSSLCVRSDGTVGDGYVKAVVAAYGGEAPKDADRHAADERLACYRHFGRPFPPTVASQPSRLRCEQSESVSLAPGRSSRIGPCAPTAS